jgi:hypothetical protein
MIPSECGIRPISGCIIKDRQYMLPAPDWFTDTFPAALKQFQFDVGQRYWSEESNDCDDFSKMAVGFAQLCHHKTQGKSNGTSLALGEFYYDAAAQGPHAIIFAIVRHAQAYRALFIEPQTCRPIDLSKAEVESCEYCLL